MTIHLTPDNIKLLLFGLAALLFIAWQGVEMWRSAKERDGVEP